VTPVLINRSFKSPTDLGLPVPNGVGHLLLALLVSSQPPLCHCRHRCHVHPLPHHLQPLLVSTKRNPWRPSPTSGSTTHVLHFQQCKIIQELFEIYGPVVRIGPNKVVFRDLSTMRSVYTVHKFDKSSYYKVSLRVSCRFVFCASITTSDCIDSNDNDHAHASTHIYAPYRLIFS